MLTYKELVMSKFMQTTGVDLPVKEIKGQRVVSYKQIAELHQVEVKNLQKNFQNNQQHFIEGTDYFKITERHPHTENFTVRKLYFTESGYLMLVKSLTDDLSWAVQRELVNGYFRGAMLEKVLAFLPRKVQKVIYYRSLGLTQKEAGLLAGMSKDSVKRVERRLKGLGYKAPNLSGKRSHFKEKQLEVAL
jgi:hypothetical protein